MAVKKSKNKLRPLLIATGSIALTIAGFAFMPHIIINLGNKVYKASLKKESINFCNMGPEIIPTQNTIDRSKEIDKKYGY